MFQQRRARRQRAGECERAERLLGRGQRAGMRDEEAAIVVALRQIIAAERGIDRVVRGAGGVAQPRYR
ncbi:hypothetical protein [Sphingomonas palmae]|uniref:hypothetical protein n=1 Tax=Sphingomonas palmae TaxID=1855283 RepID=UPI001FE09084|nr:hypothetical protein [Sphingomonas palmae]